MLGGIGATGFILLALLALLLFGPNKLPELGRAFGRTLREFKAGARDVMDEPSDKSKDRIEVNRTDDVKFDNKRLPD
ncbi:twin-arginine translocase TatA/TatE family subunit [Paenibacillus xylaniclasticus]|uniref:twin-arginine translocase TatA/TatE family subunit n=1 Tax=Paenibacillus xylaniclasticus TaxID=588083 RepID=UPI000FDA8CF7|nr:MULTISPECIES: twin-arginine translocase TatA/TatE family subunit [Paenibacillus]